MALFPQAQDRIHRISQTQTCHVWNLMASGTVDERVDSLLAAKRLAALLAQADISGEDYTAKDIRTFPEMPLNRGSLGNRGLLLRLRRDGVAP